MNAWLHESLLIVKYETMILIQHVLCLRHQNPLVGSVSYVNYVSHAYTHVFNRHSFPESLMFYLRKNEIAHHRMPAKHLNVNFGTNEHE